MNFVANRFRNFQSGLALNAEALAKYHDIIDLSIGDTDIITDRRIIDAACADAAAGYTRYGDPKGDPELIDAIRLAWREDFGEEVSREQVLVTPSSCMGMALALEAMLNPGDEVIVFGPYFSVYKQQIERVGGVCVEVSTLPQNGYAIEETSLRAAISPRTKAMIVNNPCNPTGAAYDRASLETLARVAKECDLCVIADEIYTRYVYEGAFIPLRTLPGMGERVITLNSFSKNFMMTGWRVGYAIGPADVLNVMQQINGGMIYTTPAPSQRAAIKALSLRDEIQRTSIAVYRERTYYAADRAAAVPFLSVVRPKGTFYLFPNIEKTGLDDRTFCARLLEEAHVLVSPGSAFGAAGRGHFRISCTVPTEKLKEAFDRMEKMVF